MMPLPAIDPPLLNTACPWATTKEDLQSLFDCRSTGAITTRTSLLEAFHHDSTKHQFALFDVQKNASQAVNTSRSMSASHSGSLNTFGYSPLPLPQYISFICDIIQERHLDNDVRQRKPIIFSVTGSAAAVKECYEKIQQAQANVANPLSMEVNLSCPNIPGKPPPAYSASALVEYLQTLAGILTPPGQRRVAIGIKTPPYTYHNQYQALVNALLTGYDLNCKVDFITSTNTLGSCLVLDNQTHSPLLNSASGTGVGGMAGVPLHPLSLGNVKTIRTMLDQHERLKDIDVIGVGGVCDKASFDRMRTVGASVVGVATALGRDGIDIFDKILDRQ